MARPPCSAFHPTDTTPAPIAMSRQDALSKKTRPRFAAHTSTARSGRARSQDLPDEKRGVSAVWRKRGSEPSGSEKAGQRGDAARDERYAASAMRLVINASRLRAPAP